MIPSEYRDILYVILKILNRSLKWRTVRLWTPTGSASTSRQSWMFEKNLRFNTKTEVFSNVQLWRPVEADPVGVQRRALSHFKGLFKTVKMRYSTYLYSYWIGLKYPFQKSRFTAKTPRKRARVPRFSVRSVVKCKVILELSWSTSCIEKYKKKRRAFRISFDL